MFSIVALEFEVLLAIVDDQTLTPVFLPPPPMYSFIKRPKLPIQQSTHTRWRFSHAVCKFALSTSLPCPQLTINTVTSARPGVYGQWQQLQPQQQQQPIMFTPILPSSPWLTWTTSSHYPIPLPHHPPPPSSCLQKNLCPHKKKQGVVLGQHITQQRMGVRWFSWAEWWGISARCVTASDLCSVQLLIPTLSFIM